MTTASPTCTHGTRPRKQPELGSVNGSTTSGARAALSAGVPIEVVLASAVAGSGGPAFMVDGDVIEPVVLDGPVDPTDGGGLGRLYESLMDWQDRRSLGAFYTPPEVAAALVAQVVARGTVVDPACGGGAFLLAAAQRLFDMGVGTRVEIATRMLFGADIDPLAVAVCRWTLASWAGTPSGEIAGVVVGDSLRDPAGLWAGRPEAGFEAVVGNPPFLGQVRGGTVRDVDERKVLRERFGDLVGAYTDTAWLFLALGLDLLVDQGRMALIQPQSLLAARDAASVRSRLLSGGCLEALWFDRTRIFGGRTEVCAPVVRRGSRQASVRLFVDREVSPAGKVAAPQTGERWGGLVSELLGIPSVNLRATSEAVGPVGERASVTAGFRQHYYGLVPATRERSGGSDTGSPLITTGLVDPLRCGWADQPARFAGRNWIAPVVDRDSVAGVDPSVANWLEARRRPKLLVATQTRVIEVVVDETGEMVPVTPLLIVEPETGFLWKLAAALSAPPVTAMAARTTLGAARASDRIKLSARQVCGIPLPVDEGAWSEGEELVQQLWKSAGEAGPEVWLAFGSVMCRAYGVKESPVLEWWWSRHPAGV